MCPARCPPLAPERNRGPPPCLAETPASTLRPLQTHQGSAPPRAARTTPRSGSAQCELGPCRKTARPSLPRCRHSRSATTRLRQSTPGAARTTEASLRDGRPHEPRRQAPHRPASPQMTPAVDAWPPAAQQPPRLAVPGVAGLGPVAPELPRATPARRLGTTAPPTARSTAPAPDRTPGPAPAVPASCA
jgi:hypothetical protein